MVPYLKGSFCEISLGHILIISLIILVVLSSSHFTKQSPWSAVQLLAKRLLHRFYTQRFSFSPFLLLLRNIHNGPHKATGSLFSCRPFLCVLLLNPLFSQPNGNETHRYPVVLFSPLVLSLCFSLFCCRFRFPFSLLCFFFLMGFSLMLTVVLPLFFWLIGSTKAPTMSFLSVILLLFLLLFFNF